MCKTILVLTAVLFITGACAPAGTIPYLPTATATPWNIPPMDVTEHPFPEVTFQPTEPGDEDECENPFYPVSDEAVWMYGHSDGSNSTSTMSADDFGKFTPAPTTGAAGQATAVPGGTYGHAPDYGWLSGYYTADDKCQRLVYDPAGADEYGGATYVTWGVEPVPASGTFVFERPGRFRWTYVKPYEQVLVADGERFYLYDKDLNQVTVRRMSSALPASPASILFGGNEFERDFVVAEGGTRDGMEWLTATPRDRDSQFERVEIGFRDGMPAAMVLAASFGQVSRLTFSRFEPNARLDAQLFRFVLPAGADVVEER